MTSPSPADTPTLSESWEQVETSEGVRPDAPSMSPSPEGGARGAGAPASPGKRSSADHDVHDGSTPPKSPRVVAPESCLPAIGDSPHAAPGVEGAPGGKASPNRGSVSSGGADPAERFKNLDMPKGTPVAQHPDPLEVHECGPARTGSRLPSSAAGVEEFNGGGQPVE